MKGIIRVIGLVILMVVMFSAMAFSTTNLTY